MTGSDGGGKFKGETLPYPFRELDEKLGKKKPADEDDELARFDFDLEEKPEEKND